MEVRPTGLVVVAEKPVVQAKEMPKLAPEVAMLALVEMEDTYDCSGVLRGVSHRVVLPLTPQVLGCSQAVVDPADS